MRLVTQYSAIVFVCTCLQEIEVLATHSVYAPRAHYFNVFKTTSTTIIDLYCDSVPRISVNVLCWPEECN